MLRLCFLLCHVRQLIARVAWERVKRDLFFSHLADAFIQSDLQLENT